MSIPLFQATGLWMVLCNLTMLRGSKDLSSLTTNLLAASCEQFHITIFMLLIHQAGQ